MSKPDWREPIALVEVDLDIENKDAAEKATHAEIRAVTEMMHKEKMVPPVYAASLTSNGIGCSCVFEKRACGEGHVVAVHEPQVLGALLPIHYLLTDARRPDRQAHHPRAGKFLARRHRGLQLFIMDSGSTIDVPVLTMLLPLLGRSKSLCQQG